jgi:EAL domain-containing protein (putative c-di-GMP-specific phosphodiesterase class I)
MEGATEKRDEVRSEAAGGNGIDPDELRAAIEAGRLNLYFQPIVSLADRSATMLEALPRWPTLGQGILAPSDFIEVAESSGLLDELERWAIDAAFRQLSRWDSGVAAELTISLNLSERHVYETDVAEAVRAAAEERGVAARRLGFEINEAALVGAGGRSLEKLRALADLGVALTIDDYAGRVSAEVLGELPTTAIKISRQIVAGIPDDRSRVEAATEAVERGRELELAIIASGVEGPGQLASLRDLGCRYGQGFLISLPMPAEVLEERMAPR